MRRAVRMGVLVGGLMAGAVSAWGQASEIPSAQPQRMNGMTPDQQGRKLLGEMVTALGGDAWLNRKNVQEYGRVGQFFHGQSNGYTTEFDRVRQFVGSGQGEATRIGFLTDKSVILPGKKIDVVQIWKQGQGLEVTYKGKTSLPKEQVEDYYRRQHHSIEAVVNQWLKAPDVMVTYDGTSMVERRLADKITILSADNDAVTIEIDVNTHLPLRRTFQWRNQTFKDFDEDAEEYEDYHTVQGLPTAYSITRYHNGDMISQTFLTKPVVYDAVLAPDEFNIDVLVKKK